MNTKLFKYSIASVLLLLILYSFIQKDSTPKGYLYKTTDSCECYSDNSFLTKVKIPFNNKVLGDISFTNQSVANCFAWQNFISLNWPADTTKAFGTPKDLSPVQWENFISEGALFQKNGVAPQEWGNVISNKFKNRLNKLGKKGFRKIKNSLLKDIHPKLLKSTKLDTITNLNFLLKKLDIKLLDYTSKITNPKKISLDTLNSSEQAGANGKPAWLGAQNGTNLWYEIKLNKDFYDYVVENGFYNARAQHEAILNGDPMNFPRGDDYNTVGAIELKAAWMEVTDPISKQWERYKLAKTIVLDKYTDSLRVTTVALVGLHILHKTESQPTWVWTTFEHIDNVPDDSYTHPYGFNFYNSQCTKQKVKLRNGSEVTVDCTPNERPPFFLKEAAPVPIQITRKNAINKDFSQSVNKRMQDNIRAHNPKSVWQYYQLVDVIWSQGSQEEAMTKPEILQAPPKEFNTFAMASGANIVANTTLESYTQEKTCFTCHVNSKIAPYPPTSSLNKTFGDFSFAIGSAKYNEEEVKNYLENAKK